MNENQERGPTASTLYLRWIPPNLNAPPPKVRYPTTKDMPPWLDTTPIRDSFPKGNDDLDTACAYTYRGVFTAPKDTTPSHNVRPEDLYLNWLPPVPLKTRSGPRVAIDASTQVAAWVCTSTENVRVFDINSSRSKRGLPTIPPNPESSSRIAIDASLNVAAFVHTCASTIRLVNSTPSTAKTKNTDLEKPLPAIPSPSVLPEIYRFSGFRPDSVLAAGQRVAEESEVCDSSFHLEQSRHGPVMLQAMLVSGDVARAKRRSGEARDGKELLRTLESFDRFFEGCGEEQGRDAWGSLRVLERYDWVFAQV